MALSLFGLLFLLVIITKSLIWLLGLFLSSYGRRIGFGVKWTSDQGEYIVIAGACGHIGAEYAREFASMGFNLILIGRDANKLQRLAESFQERNYPVTDIQIVEADFAAADFVDIAKDALDEVTPIVGLVNAISLSYAAKRFTELTAPKVKDMVMANVLAPTMLIDILLPKMSQAQRGVIINLSSQAAKYKVPYYSVFGATKAYMHVLSESLSFEYSKRGVTVQNVAPLFINSTMAAEVKENALRVSSALSVFSAMQTVGIESTTYGYWSHRVVALCYDIVKFFLGGRLATTFMAGLMKSYVDIKKRSSKLKKISPDGDDDDGPEEASSNTSKDRKGRKSQIERTNEESSMERKDSSRPTRPSSNLESDVEHIPVAMPGPAKKVAKPN